MDRPPGCKCDPNSPFLWAQHVRESFAMEERTMRAVGPKRLSKSQLSALTNDRLREEGKELNMIRGLGRNREEELTRLRNFTTYSRANKNAAEKT